MRIFIVFFLTGLLCNLPVMARSQFPERDMDRRSRDFMDQFEETISRNTEESGSSENFFFPNPEWLPSWLFTKPAGTKDHIYVIAASDPGMDADSAMELAILRAKILAGLTTGLQVAHLREYYSSERGQEITHVFTEYTLFTGVVPAHKEHVEVVRQHTTQYDETIILARLPYIAPGDVSDSLAGGFEAGLYTRLRGVGNRMQIEERLSMEATPGKVLSFGQYQYQYAKIGRIVNSTTTIDDILISDLPALNLRYAFRGEDTQSPGEGLHVAVQGVSLRYGFWHALVAGMLSAMVDESHKGSVHFRQLGDMYDAMMLSMSMELTTKWLILSMPSLMLEENTLYLTPFVQSVHEE